MSVPARIDRYRIVEIIGTGGFATVYRAIDERFDTPVAIKVLADNHAFNPEIRERFITEVHLLRRLAGIPAVAVYDLGETEQGQPFAVMALADGDLADRVRRFRGAGNTIGWPEVGRVIDELTRSLEPLHARGIVHRDIKPSNLLVFGELGTDRSDGRAGQNTDVLLNGWEALRLGDLGFAKDLLYQSGLTAGGGTPGFMPPEQARPGRVDTRADIYAATAVIVWLICDQVPTSLGPTELEDRVVAILGSGCSTDGLRAGLAGDLDQRPQTIARWRELLYGTLAPTELHSAGVGRSPAADATGIDAAPPGPGGRTLTPSQAGSESSTEGPNRPLRTIAVAAFGVMAGLAGVASAPVLGFGGDGVEVDRSENGDEVRRSRTVDDLTIAVVGPEQIEVGQDATFTAEVTGARSVQWIGPDGTVADGTDPLVVRAGRSGDGSVSLLATSVESGEAVVVEAPFEVIEP